ncbi:MAG: MotA/TolQ/ExbB proton channel family protein [Planctomycetota bacterium]|nr:MotA/TolQ/ExbB proton channel family protein [Planctomycetota bacterium]
MSRWVFAVVLVLAVVGAGILYAQEGAPKKPAQQASQSWLGLIWEGSKFMAIGIVIILLSFVMVALIVEHFMYIKRDQIVPPELVAHLEQLLEDEEYEEAMTLCESAPNFLTNVVAAGLARLGRPYEEIEAAMAEAGDQESVKLFQRISYLSLIGTVSPMLGLFGTVAGMIQAFSVIAGSESQPKPKELAYGIMTALVTTFLGLIVAIPSTAAYFFFRNKVIRIIMEVGTIAEELMQRFRTAGEEGAAPATV